MGKISMKGVCDMHVHTNPDLRLRAYDDFELADAAVRVGARAIVIKTHLGFTVNRAYLTNQYVKKVYRFHHVRRRCYEQGHRRYQPGSRRKRLKAGCKRDLASYPVCKTPFRENGPGSG